MSKLNLIVKVKLIGEDDTLILRYGKIYDAVIGQLGLICLVDETGEEYAFKPNLFEIVKN